MPEHVNQGHFQVVNADNFCALSNWGICPKCAAHLIGGDDGRIRPCPECKTLLQKCGGPGGPVLIDVTPQVQNKQENKVLEALKDAVTFCNLLTQLPLQVSIPIRNEAGNRRAQLEEAISIVSKHEICHDLHGKVGAEEFCKGCEAEVMKEFGKNPWQEYRDAHPAFQVTVVNNWTEWGPEIKTVGLEGADKPVGPEGMDNLC